jgi:hypothetical protein
MKWTCIGMDARLRLSESRVKLGLPRIGSNSVCINFLVTLFSSYLIKIKVIYPETTPKKDQILLHQLVLFHEMKHPTSTLRLVLQNSRLVFFHHS